MVCSTLVNYPNKSNRGGIMRRFAFRAFIFSLNLVAFSSAFGQLRSSTEPVEIRGQLRYARGGAPAPNVVVRLESLNGGYVGEERTDNLGKFRFPNLLPIQYFVNVRQPGFKEIQREVNLVMIPSDYIQLQLVPEESGPATATANSAKLLDARVPLEARKEFEKGEAALLNPKRIDEGIVHLQKALQIYPNFVEAELRLGTVYMDRREWDQAEQALKRALEIEPKAANAQFALGAMYLQQEKFDAAEHVLLKGLAIEYRSWQGHFTLGRVYWNRKSSGDLVKAGRQIALTLQLNPDLADAHLMAGNIFLRANKPDDAVPEFEDYLRLAPKGEFAKQVRETIQKLQRSQRQK
jgi:Carboxypeptidase regulatory-like domain/Tetratricopeptide repeat